MPMVVRIATDAAAINSAQDAPLNIVAGAEICVRSRIGVGGPTQCHEQDKHSHKRRTGRIERAVELRALQHFGADTGAKGHAHLSQALTHIRCFRADGCRLVAAHRALLHRHIKAICHAAHVTHHKADGASFRHHRVGQGLKHAGVHEKRLRQHPDDEHCRSGHDGPHGHVCAVVYR